jgi:hypothetical protein
MYIYVFLRCPLTPLFTGNNIRHVTIEPAKAIGFSWSCRSQSYIELSFTELAS